ncbi:hypothetical protein DFP80_103210 [Marinomonas rhizomae]|uniref:Late embryogenesis abundant protein n=2 Tax=Marinomonas rhizomae TaxID=491948 RepID=A0A366JD37_9GAMM|nr:hypothetical protein DFP80_103210 [Marinomonas rhizomae]
MKYIKVIVCSFILISTLAQSQESALDKVKGGAQNLWEKTKTATVEIADTTAEKASELGDKASKLGRKASSTTKETSGIVWDKMKEAGAATADSARKGASKIREFVDQDECQGSHALCDKRKE